MTAYQADCGKQGAPKALGFMTCGDRNKCIYQKYKCDKHYNCATDNGTRPADEMVQTLLFSKAFIMFGSRGAVV